MFLLPIFFYKLINVWGFLKMFLFSYFCSEFQKKFLFSKIYYKFKKSSRILKMFMFSQKGPNFWKCSLFEICLQIQKIYVVSKNYSNFTKCFHFKKLFINSEDIQEFQNLFLVSKFVRVCKKVQIVKFCSCLSKNVCSFSNFLFLKIVWISKISSCFLNNVSGFSIFENYLNLPKVRGFHKMLLFVKSFRSFKMLQYLVRADTAHGLVATVPNIVQGFATTLLPLFYSSFKFHVIQLTQHSLARLAIIRHVGSSGREFDPRWRSLFCFICLRATMTFARSCLTLLGRPIRCVHVRISGYFVCEI